MKTNKIFKYTSVGVVYAWLLCFALLPIVLVIITSFLSHTPEQLIIWKFTFRNYTQLFSNIYLQITYRSLELAGACTFFCLLIGYPAAFILARMRHPSKPTLLILMIIPFWTSALIRTYAMMAILKTKGLLNTALLSLGLIHHPLQLLYSNAAVLIGCTYNLLPFMILPLYANIEKLDNRLIEAARDLGASRIRLFRRIILPLTMPGIIAGSTLVFLPAMTLFYIPVLLGGAKSLLLGNLIQNQFLQMQDWPGGSATSMILTITMLLLIAIYHYVGTRREHREALL